VTAKGPPSKRYSTCTADEQNYIAKMLLNPALCLRMISSDRRPAKRLREAGKPLHTLDHVEGKLFEIVRLERVFAIGRVDRAVPDSMEFNEHLLRRSQPGCDDVLQRLEVARFVTPLAIEHIPALQA
jgi:hypothetical protein